MRIKGLLSFIYVVFLFWIANINLGIVSGLIILDYVLYFFLKRFGRSPKTFTRWRYP